MILLPSFIIILPAGRKGKSNMHDLYSDKNDLFIASAGYIVLQLEINM
jgi:hypothetical protein